MLSIDMYQTLVTAAFDNHDYPDPLGHLALGVAGEAGEIADLVKKSQYEVNRDAGVNRDRMIEEMGDELWYLANMASKMGVTLSEIAAANIRKLRARHPKDYPVGLVL